MFDYKPLSVIGTLLELCDLKDGNLNSSIITIDEITHLLRLDFYKFLKYS